MIYLAVIYALTLVMTGGLVKALLDERGRSETAWRDERADLLQRIQAPEHAVIKHFNEQQPEDTVRAVNEFIDDDYWPTRDELADRAAEAEVTGA